MVCKTYTTVGVQGVHRVFPEQINLFYRYVYHEGWTKKTFTTMCQLCYMKLYWYYEHNNYSFKTALIMLGLFFLCFPKSQENNLTNFPNENKCYKIKPGNNMYIDTSTINNTN